MSTEPDPPETSPDPVAVRCIAVVVSFEAPDRLEQCLEAIAVQRRPADLVIVVNNGQRRTVEPLLADYGAAYPLGPVVQLVQNPVNNGPAGGHHLGMTTALALGADWVWLMDDDLTLQPNCLAALLEQAGSPEDAVMVWPEQVSTDGVLLNYPGWYAVLISRVAVRLGGLPRADLVWWIEDTEYLQWRMPNSGVRVLRSVDTRVEHTDARVERSRPAWKTYYETRNTIWYRWHEQKRVHVTRLLVTLAKILVRTLVSPGRWVGLRGFVRGGVDGFRGRLGLRWPLPNPSGDTR